MKKGNIYWLTGLVDNEQSVLSKWLVELLQTDKRNWRKSVFHLNEETLPSLSTHLTDSKPNKATNYRDIELVAKYLHYMGCDVVVSIEDTNPPVLSNFKKDIGAEYFNEFYLTTDGNRINVDSDVVKINIQKVNTEKSFTKIVNHLKDINKL